MHEQVDQEDKGAQENNALVTRRELIRAALGCALVVVLFLAPTLFRGRILSPADMLFGYYPWHDQQPTNWSGPSNDLLIDSANQFEPWMEYSSERLQSGSLPLWNPDNMLGAPFIGNMQSAVFFPPHWLYFLWPIPQMLVLIAWLKLFIAAFGTYLLARSTLQMGPLGASVAAITFSFGAFMTVWLLHPQTAVASLLPWFWWASARLIERPSRRNVAVVAVIVALTLLAGHPQTAAQVLISGGAFALYQAWQTVPQRGQRFRAIGFWGLACLLGVLVASIQLLPFLEYLSDSMALLRRNQGAAVGLRLPPQSAWTLITPDLFGNPSHRDAVGSFANYNELNTYTGILPLLLAPFAFMKRSRAGRRQCFFLIGAILVALTFIYRPPVIYEAMNAIPGMRLATSIRLLFIVQFAIGLLAGFGLETLARRLLAQRRELLVRLSAVLLLLLTVGLGIPLLLAHSYFEVPVGEPEGEKVWQTALWHGVLLLGVCSVLLAAAIWLRIKNPRTQKVIFCLVPALLLVDLFQAHIGYLPSVELAQYFPDTKVTDFLRQQSGLFRVDATLSVLRPNTNLHYGIADLRGDDAVESQLYNDLTSRSSQLAPALTETAGRFIPSPVLDLLNVRYVISAPGDDPNYTVDTKQDASSGTTVGEIAGAFRPGQTFVALHDNLAQIQVLGATFGGKAKGNLIFHLKNSPDEQSDMATVTLDARHLQDITYWTVNFPPVRQAFGRSFYFYFEAPQAKPGQAATIWYSKDNAYPQGTRTDNGTPTEGDLAFRAASLVDPENPRFKRVLDSADSATSIFENQRSLPRAWLVHNSETVQERDSRILRLRDPNFDPRTTALLNEVPPPDWTLAGSSGNKGDRVIVNTYEPETVRITTQSASAGLLVLSDLDFPGWEARIDSRLTSIVTADHALRAVYVPTGEHVVTFSYVPGPFWTGAVITVLALILVLLLVAWRVRPGNTPNGLD